MLKEILSISGKSGLYRLLTQGRNSLIVETIGPEKRRMPIYGTDKVISLGDIAMYTETDERPLPQVLQSLYDKQEGKTVSMDFKKASKEELFGFFAGILPDFDRDRVHPSDIKKLIQWYNLLVEGGFTRFAEQESQEAAAETAGEEA